MILWGSARSMRAWRRREAEAMAGKNAAPFRCMDQTDPRQFDASRSALAYYERIFRHLPKFVRLVLRGDVWTTKEKTFSEHGMYFPINVTLGLPQDFTRRGNCNRDVPVRDLPQHLHRALAVPRPPTSNNPIPP